MRSQTLIAAMGAAILLAAEVAGQPGGDYLVVTPPKPTNLDSLHFQLQLASHCCCSEFVNKSVNVQDTAVYLSFAVNDSFCQLCDCFMGGSSTGFASGSLKAGTYGIYALESIYCPPGQFCIAIAPTVKRVGEVTVSPPAGVERGAVSAAAGIEVNPNPLRSSTRIRLGQEFKNSNPALKILDLRGRLVADLSRAAAGKAGVEWSPAGIPAGVYVIRAEAGGRILTKRVLIE